MVLMLFFIIIIITSSYNTYLETTIFQECVVALIRAVCFNLQMQEAY